jgi:pimeloyl-ACP methyl ester carboxylesterase
MVQMLWRIVGSRRPAKQESDTVRQVPGEAATPLTRLAELPGRGTTRVWECAGPPGAETLMLIHGVTFTAELNWAKVIPPLARHFRVVALDLRGHGDGISAGPRFRLEDCADDVAALAGALGVGRFIAVGYSMGGMVAQLLCQRHAPLLSGLVLCATARNVLGSPAERLAALTLPTTAAALLWNPLLRPMSAEILGTALIGPVDDPATARWARDQLRRTTLATAISAIQAACEFTSHTWIGQVDVPAAVVVTARDRIVPVSRQMKLARAIPGASVHEVDADHAVCVTSPQVFTQALLQACWSVRAGGGQVRPALTGTAP